MTFCYDLSHQSTPVYLSHSSAVICRFQRLSKNTNKASLADFQLLPELCMNPFIPRIFQIYDTDRDGYISFDDFTRAVQDFGRMTGEADKCNCKLTYLRPCWSGLHSTVVLVFCPVLRCFAHHRNSLTCILLGAVAFTLYDLNGDGFVSGQEMFQTLKMLMGRGKLSSNVSSVSG